jgi:[CysO sulfur-carrier protein]-S-L-cysteine hydrolase
MRVPSEIYEQLMAHAEQDAPNECCGLIGGRDGAATTLYRARNAEASPLRYRIADQEVFDVRKQIEEKGEDLVAIYHSHTASPAYPSQTDINLAFWEWSKDGQTERALAWPGTIYLIASLAEGEKPLRGFDITEAAEVVEVELEIE